jgi:hypothetical protein
MPKFIHDDAMDAALDSLAACTILFILSGEPTSYSDAASTKDLATHVLTAGAGNGDWTKANGDTSGRKLTLAAQNGITVDHTGTATYWAIGISGSSKLMAYGTLTSQALTQGNTVNFPALDVDEIADPT